MPKFTFPVCYDVAVACIVRGVMKIQVPCLGSVAIRNQAWKWLAVSIRCGLGIVIGIIFRFFTQTVTPVQDGLERVAQLVAKLGTEEQMAYTLDRTPSYSGWTPSFGHCDIMGREGWFEEHEWWDTHRQRVGIWQTTAVLLWASFACECAVDMWSMCAHEDIMQIFNLLTRNKAL
jgi:hypothetical protein